MFLSSAGGQFAPVTGGQFESATGGQLKSVGSGQVHRFLQLRKRAILQMTSWFIVNML